MAAATLDRSLAQNHKINVVPHDPERWMRWQRDPMRARTWFVKGGPGQGKSTLTQYVSQIQRAALILQPNGPIMLPPQRALAEEIRRAASDSSLWPAVPRIPLVIDLKEFAFWFGRKSDDTSDRMIAYITEHLANEVGETVKTGTLRRAFASARWLFVFDGLDEVPGDVKNPVANEVTHFVNDLLTGCGSDAAIVCTSRPQGYSGQFANLDAAIVELVSLSRDQALACAEPLLALDRSESERRAYVQTLREALESEAITEIMTTPLQAHIMAVVVRDGGKPPERKWQLFNTFYEIIKKREANRNLPDRKLATLLREGDKLLKALHNRLGFELHARAETSQGAVTSLGRNELLAIVKEVVSQLQDSDIVETVTTLMRATTERLVLVSTPETGEYVRFDIRPLQEFFAAEHIYQSGEPDIFIERVRVIAGDSHWREVIHFLLSALIENNRKSELAGAITVLMEIDESDEPESRVLNRRLGRGGIVAARLLQEGVLEQDKRVREQFRNSILPLLGCPDADRYLAEIRSTHTLQWLVDVLIASLREQAESETIGAAVSLVYFVSDADPRCQHLRRFLLEASNEYQAFVLSELQLYLNSDAHPPVWLAEFSLAVLLKDDWWRLGVTAVKSALNISAHFSETIDDVAITCGVSREVARMAAELLLPDKRAEYSPHRMKSKPDHSEVRYGVLEISYFKPLKALNWKSWPPKIWSALRASHGILYSVYCVFNLMKLPTASSLTAYLASIGGVAENCRLLPDNVSTFVTDNDFRRSSRRPRPSDFLERIYPGFARFLELNPSRDSIDWNSLIDGDSWLALYLLATHRQTAGEFIERFPEQKKQIENFSTSGLLYTVPNWGVLFSLPKGWGSGLRNLALRAAAGTVGSEFYQDQELREFQIDLPREAPMLPHLLAALLDNISPSSRRVYWKSESRLPARKEISMRMVKYLPSRADLVRTATDQSLPKRVQAAAKILACLHPDNTADSEDLPTADDIVKFYDPLESHWYLPGIALLLTEKIAANEATAIKAMGSLLSAANSDFRGRKAASYAIQGWRELARAPVQRLANPQLWS